MAAPFFRFLGRGLGQRAGVIAPEALVVLATEGTVRLRAGRKAGPGVPARVC